jgi:isocitrate dehydrogenase kinase/phosphatase
VAAATLTERFATELSAAAADKERTRLVAAWIFDSFTGFYAEFQRLTWLAQTAFEERDPAAAVAGGTTRLGLYDATVHALADDVRRCYPSLMESDALWLTVEDTYRRKAQDRYDGDLAIAFLQSLWRRVHHGEWRPVDYTLGELSRPVARREDAIAIIHCRGPLEATVVRELLAVGNLALPYRDLEADAVLVAQRLNDSLAADTSPPERVEMIRGCFFRNRGAYLVGRLLFQDGRVKPLVIALHNGEEGLIARAVLVTVPHVHNLFNTTQAAFHVTNLHYHEIAELLLSIMPRRPLGLQYAIFGYYHFSKVAAAGAERGGPGHRAGLTGNRGYGLQRPLSCLRAQGHPRSPHGRLQVGTVPGPGRGARQVRAGAPHQPHRQHAG